MVDLSRKLFPKHIGLKVTNLDLLGLIENEELFGKLGDVVRVCLLLALEVTFVGRLLVQEVDDTLMRWEHLQGINTNHKFVPTYTLSGFVWAFKDSKPIYDLRLTIAERRSDWYKLFIDFFLHYIPMTPPIRATRICDDYLQKLFAARKREKIERKDLPIIRRSESSIIEISLIQDGVITELNARAFKLEVYARERNVRVSGKLDFNDDFSNLSADFCDELNYEFLELFESTICLSGSARLDLDSDEDVAKEYIVQEELRLRVEEKERVSLKEQKMMEEDNRPDKADWVMVSSYFVQLLLQKMLPLWYANEERYVIPWCDANQRISSNPRNRQIAQPGINMGQDRQMQMVGDNDGNQFRQYAGQNVRNLNGYNAIQNVKNQNPNGNGNLVAARAEGNATGFNGNQIRCYNCRGVGSQFQAEEFDLMAAAADLDKIEEVNANCILMANLHQPSTSEEQYTKLLEPIHEPLQVPQNDNNVIFEVTSVEQSEGNS
nr:hypothetical protein [Tanacetum cinerariifolium]